MNYVNFYKLKPGDKIVVPKSWLKLILHYVIYLGKDHFGRDLIAENTAGSYVRVITAEQFFNENPVVSNIERFQGNNYERKLCIERALKLLGKPYDLINFNCEHFANYVQTGEMSSRQVGWGLALLGILALVVLSD